MNAGIIKIALRVINHAPAGAVKARGSVGACGARTPDA
jgi:hypothetical protein